MLESQPMLFPEMVELQSEAKMGDFRPHVILKITTPIPEAGRVLNFQQV